MNRSSGPVSAELAELAHLSHELERRLASLAARTSGRAAWAGVALAARLVSKAAEQIDGLVELLELIDGETTR